MITLVIIGIIAAITVPTLITKYQKEQTVTRLKKTFSSLSQSATRAITDYGDITTWEIGEASNADTAKAFFIKYMAPYLNISKGPTTFSEYNWSVHEYKWLNGSEHNYSDYYVRTYLSDGTSLTYRIQNNNTNVKQFTIHIDINGDKKPNMAGKDIFECQYFIKSTNTAIQGKFLPSGLGNSRETLLDNTKNTNCNKQQSGFHCMALIIKDGWRISDDYPW